MKKLTTKYSFAFRVVGQIIQTPEQTEDCFVIGDGYDFETGIWYLAVSESCLGDLIDTEDNYWSSEKIARTWMKELLDLFEEEKKECAGYANLTFEGKVLKIEPM